MAEELRIKADAIEPCGGGDGPAGGFHNGGEKIGGVDEVIIEAGLNAAGPAPE